MGQASGIHIRLMLTRGLKSTPYQDPRVTIGRPTIVILPEYKESPAEGGPREKGLRLFTVRGGLCHGSWGVTGTGNRLVPGNMSHHTPCHLTPLPPNQVHVRRGPPDVQDPALNSHSKINCITACIQVGGRCKTVCICQRELHATDAGGMYRDRPTN
jgi:hypothetical protein